MSLVREILTALWETELYYKGGTYNIFGIPKFSSKRDSVRATLARMKKRGLAKKQHGTWSLTTAGKKYYQEKVLSFPHFPSPFKKNAPKNLIVMFDVPEQKKAYRDWLRGTLKRFGYEFIQQSVWVGPSPLPRDFVAFIKKINLADCVRVFKLSKSYDTHKNIL